MSHRPTPVADMAAQMRYQQMQQAQQAQQSKSKAAWLIIAALLVYGFWPKISPLIPDELNPVPVASNPFGTTDSLHVLIAYPAEASLTREQDIIVNSTRLIEAVPKGNLRRLDTETVFMPEEKLWQDVMAKAKPLGPFTIAVGNGGSGYLGVLPATEDATLELVNKYK